MVSKMVSCKGGGGEIVILQIIAMHKNIFTLGRRTPLIERSSLLY